MNAHSPQIAVVTARAAREMDEDLPSFEAALRQSGATFHLVEWDDPDVPWASFDVAVVRSTWDYPLRLAEFLAWSSRVSELTELWNPAPVIRWNTDKHYLAELSAAGVPVVPGRFIEPGQNASGALDELLARQSARELVVKPAVSAGARDTQRHDSFDRVAVLEHIDQLLRSGRSVLVQPYLERVDEQGERALIYFDGRFSHAIRKGPILGRGSAATMSLFAPETIASCTPGPEQLRLAEQALAAAPYNDLLYARVDLIEDETGASRLLELELTEPSLFLDHAVGATDRFVAGILRRVGARSG